MHFPIMLASCRDASLYMLKSNNNGNNNGQVFLHKPVIMLIMPVSLNSQSLVKINIDDVIKIDCITCLQGQPDLF